MKNITKLTLAALFAFGLLTQGLFAEEDHATTPSEPDMLIMKVGPAGKEVKIPEAELLQFATDFGSHAGYRYEKEGFLKPHTTLKNLYERVYRYLVNFPDDSYEKRLLRKFYDNYLNAKDSFEPAPFSRITHWFSPSTYSLAEDVRVGRMFEFNDKYGQDFL